MKPDVNFEPTPHDLVERMLDLAELKAGETLYDLGCGDGRILAAALRRGAIVRGWDCDRDRVLESRDALKQIGGDWIVREGNLFDVDLSGADVVTAFLLPELNDRLLPTLRRMKPRARFVSHLFGLTGLPADVERGWPYPHLERKIYLWRAPIGGRTMAKPKLTLGMASFRDYYGVYDTVQSARLYHPEAMDKTEILLVDNEPDGPHGKYNRDLFAWLQQAGQLSTYIPFAGVVGTAAPRELVMRQAHGEIVLCCDSHVKFAPGALRRLIRWFDANPTSRDLVTGPMVYDGLQSFNTHMNDVWRDDMWGVWGAAWECPCGFHFSLTQKPPSQLARDGTQSLGECVYLTLSDPQERVTKCPTCGAELPAMGWAGHEEALAQRGFKMLGGDVDAAEFEIPAAGLGTFACRKDAWQGFNPRFRGFGGEEWYIHRKTRKAGGRCLNLPFLRWLHRYGNPSGPADQRPKWHIYRNYVIGHAELGLPVEHVRANMTTPIPDGEWAQLVADPLNPPEWPAAQQSPQTAGCVGCGQQTVAVAPSPLPAWDAITGPHSEKYREFAAQAPVMLLTGKTRAELSTALCNNHQQAQRFIAIYGTADPALGDALRNFLHHERAWTVVYRATNDGGFTVLSKDQRDKSQPPGLMRQALNFAKASAAHVAAGSPTVDDATFAARLDTCMVCEHRNMDQCSKCGCFIDWKATWAEQSCPADPPRWGKALPVVAA